MIDSFDPMNETHVTWLRDIIEAKGVTEKLKLFDKSPIKNKNISLDMPQALFGLSMKYTRAIFQEKALILKNKNH
jgi:hypothetical protein